MVILHQRKAERRICTKENEREKVRRTKGKSVLGSCLKAVGNKLVEETLETQDLVIVRTLH